jgi:enoyl-CoA hydratase/carnithine racemase
MTVRVERPAEHVAELVMDRPEARNALSTEQARRLAAAARELAADPTVSVVVLASTRPDAFCVGADLKERLRLSDDELQAQRAVFVEAFAAVRELAVPTVAAVDGHALGGGCELALSCDLVVAGESATFGLPEVGLGLVPGGGGTQLLSRRVGTNRALDLILTGRRLGAEEAERLGLADRLVLAGGAWPAARELAAEIARHSPVSLRAAKRAVRDGSEVDLAAGLDLEDQAWREAAFSPDRREGVAAFNERRPPQWPSWGDAAGG